MLHTCIKGVITEQEEGVDFGQVLVLRVFFVLNCNANSMHCALDAPFT